MYKSVLTYTCDNCGETFSTDKDGELDTMGIPPGWWDVTLGTNDQADEGYYWHFCGRYCMLAYFADKE